MSFTKGAVVAGLALSLATCAYAHYAEQNYRLKKLEEKVEKPVPGKTSLMEQGWKSLPEEKRAAVFLDGLDSAVQVQLAETKKKVGRMYQGVKYELSDITKGDEDDEK